MMNDGGAWANSAHKAGVCFPGVYCLEGTDVVPDKSHSNVCPSGHYCPAGTYEPIQCPAGTFSAVTGLENVTQCMVVEAGSYSLVGSTEATGICDPGWYCPAGSTRETQYPCPIGRYGSTEGLKTAACTDACRHPLDCDLGSTHDGYLPHERYPSIW